MTKRKLYTIAIITVLIMLIPITGYIFYGKDKYYNYVKENPLFLGWYLDEGQVFDAFSIENYQDINNLSNTGTDILPIKFWNLLKKQFIAQKNYINDPTFVAAIKLEYYNFFTNLHYKKDILEYKEGVSKLFPSKLEQPIVNVASSTNNRVILDDFSLLTKNSKQLNREIYKRITTLLGLNYYSSHNREISVDKINREINSIKDTEDLFWGPGATNIRGPYLVNTTCFGNESEFFYLFDFDYNGQNVTAIKLATENYYEKLSPNIELEKEFLNKGYNWKPIRESNPYRCSDLTYQADLYTIDYILESLRNDKNFIDQSDTNHKGLIYKIDAITSKNQVVSYSDIQELANIYLDLYKKENNAILSSDYLKNYLIIKNKDMSLAKLFETNLYYDELFTRLANFDVGDLQRKFIYLTRNPYSVSYLTFSESSYLLKEKPKFISNHYTNNQFISETELKKSDPGFNPKSHWFLNDRFLLSN